MEFCQSKKVGTLSGVYARRQVSLSLCKLCSASKCAAFGLNEALSEELRVVYKKPGVHTSVVCPMFVNTALVQEHLHKVNVIGG